MSIRSVDKLIVSAHRILSDLVSYVSIYSCCMNFVQRRLFLLLLVNALDIPTQKNKIGTQ